MPEAEVDFTTWSAWRTLHQPFELNWWKEALAQGHSSDALFFDHWKPVIDFIQPTGRVIDIGCGPRPPIVPCWAIDPLILEYKQITPKEWWQDVICFEQPAEVLISPLADLFDTIVCWNCLDHTIGWTTILDNMVTYAKKEARLFVATDFQEPFLGHPGINKKTFMEDILLRFNIVEVREKFGHHELALSLTVRRTENV